MRQPLKAPRGLRRREEHVRRLESVALTEVLWENDADAALDSLIDAIDKLLAAEREASVNARSPRTNAPRSAQSFRRLTEWLRANGVAEVGYGAPAASEDSLSHHDTRPSDAAPDYCRPVGDGDASPPVYIAAIDGGSAVGGGGVFARRAIRRGECIAAVPRALMLSADAARRHDELARLFTRDPLLRRVESLALAVCVLYERLRGERSPFAPYLDALPERFDVPLYFGRDALRTLRPSSAHAHAVRRIRGNARHYCYLYAALKAAQLEGLPVHRFTFGDFRWAVSVVMTRQNRVPFGDDAEVYGDGDDDSMLALVPLWDMCNHAEGEYSTQYNALRRRVECFAMDNASAGEQVHIYYGPRPSSELLVHSGFVPAHNAHDRVEVELRLDDDDELTKIRIFLLTKQQLASAPLAVGGGGGGGGRRGGVTGSVDVHGVACATLRAVSRIAVLRRADADVVLRQQPDMRSETLPTALDPDVDRRAATHLRALLQSMLVRYEEGLPSSREARPAANAIAEHHVHLCARLLSLERDILQRAVDRLPAAAEPPLPSCGA